MDLCSNGHDEICHNERTCPLCEAKEEIKRWEKEDYEGQITTLKDEIQELKASPETSNNKRIKNVV